VNKMTKKSECLHRYKKRDIGRNGKEYVVYFCLKAGCSHYIPVNMAEGRECECFHCHSRMTIDKTVLSRSSGKPMTRPHCPNCIRRKKAKDVDKIAEFLEGITIPLPVNET